MPTAPSLQTDFVPKESILSLYSGDPGQFLRLSRSIWVPVIALEIQYEWLDTVDFSNAAPGKFAEYNPQTVTANVKLFLPSGALQPYLLAGAGIGFWELDTLALGSGLGALNQAA